MEYWKTKKCCQYTLSSLIFKDESFINFWTHCVIITQKALLSSPCSLLFKSFRDFWQSQKFSEKNWMSLTAKKVNFTLLLFFWVAFFLITCGFQKKRESFWRNYFILIPDWGGHKTANIQTALIIWSVILHR